MKPTMSRENYKSLLSTHKCECTQCRHLSGPATTLQDKNAFGVFSFLLQILDYRVPQSNFSMQMAVA